MVTVPEGLLRIARQFIAGERGANFFGNITHKQNIPDKLIPAMNCRAIFKCPYGTKNIFFKNLLKLIL